MSVTAYLMQFTMGFSAPMRLVKRSFSRERSTFMNLALNSGKAMPGGGGAVTWLIAEMTAGSCFS